MDQDAGNPRRRFLLGGAALIAAGCAGTPPAAPKPPLPLNPVRGLLGARLATQVDPTGTPLPAGIGPYRPFVFPVAVAATVQDIYVADAGAGRIFRYDRSLDVMVAMPATARQGTRLQAGGDGSLYVLDPASSEIRRYSRAGTALPALLPRLPTSRYREFTLDPATGRAYALDLSHLTVDRIEPLGRIAMTEFPSGEATALAATARALFVADRACGCVVERRDGQAARHLGGGELRLPAALAADRGHLYVLDAFDRSIAIVYPGGVMRIAAADLGLMAPEALAAFAGLLYVADGAGHAVAIFEPAGKKTP